MSETKIENQEKSRGGLTIILFAGWAIGLLAAFLAFRGANVGQLPVLLGGAGGSFFGASGFIATVLGFLIALLVFAAWFGLGSLISSFIRITPDENSSKWLKFTISTAIGAAAWSLIWFFLGLAGAYNKPVAAAALLLGLILAAWKFTGFRKEKSETAERVKFSGQEKFLIALTLIPVILALIASLAPPTAKDALLYHFAVPKVFVAQGGNALVEGNIASYLPLGTEMHSVWAMLLGGFSSPRTAEAAAGATIFLFFPLLLLAIYGWARELKLAGIWSAVAVLVFATVPTAYHVAASGYIDLALALYVTLSIYALGRWWNTLENRWLVYVAIFLGAALSVKLTALFVFAAFALTILLRARQAKTGEPAGTGKVLASGIIALVLGGLIASPWYLRTWKETGSPIFPFYMNIWKGQAPGWDAERSALFQLMNSRYGGAAKNVFDYILSPFKISILAQPEQAAFFDGVIGVVFLFGLPVLIWALWKYDLPAEIKAALGVCLVIFLFWLFSSEQLRYLLPIFPVLAIAICAAAETISKNKGSLSKVWQVSLVGMAMAAGLTGFAWFLQKIRCGSFSAGKPGTNI